MQSAPRADPPYVPIRHTAWPVRRTPRWWFAAGAAVLVVGALRRRAMITPEPSPEDGSVKDHGEMMPAGSGARG